MKGFTLVERLSVLVGPLSEIVAGVFADVQPVAVVLGVIKTAIHASPTLLKSRSTAFQADES